MVENSATAKKKVWLVAVNMGYGHQRTAYPLRDLAFGGQVINVNNYKGIPDKDKKFWQTARYFYEFVSRFKRIPIIGTFVFYLMNRLQMILSYYPKRDLSKANINVRQLFYFIRKGWGQDLVEKMKKNPLPLISTFFTPAFMAEEFGYKNDIYCVICDADIARGWVSLDPEKSNIKYFASNTWTRDRLKLYGVKPENITLTGYPLPKENIGEQMEIVKKDLSYRLLNLDPRGKYRRLYAPLIKGYLGKLPDLPNHPLTIMFSIGGAGAQGELAVAIINNLKEKIRAKELRFIISVGTRTDLTKYFSDHIKSLELDGWVSVLSGKTMEEYFGEFNKALRTTDILMTKPSELSFYAGLGIPIIIEPSIGSQEDFNRRWLMHIGAAVSQESVKYTDQWLFDLINAGDFAEMAMQGFIEIEKMGTYTIERIMAK